MSKALLVIDIQNDYFPGGKMPLSNPEAAAQNASQIINKCRSIGIPVIYIQHIATKPNALFFLPETEGVLIHNLVKPEIAEKIITKSYPNSFRETELLDYLKSLNITELIITGMMSQMCVDTTVRAANDLGFKCCVAYDACTCPDLHFNGVKISAQDVNNTFMASLAMAFADVTDSANICKNL